MHRVYVVTQLLKQGAAIMINRKQKETHAVLK